MKKILLLGLSVLYGFVSSACDVCACSSSAQTPGILPVFNNHLFGISYTSHRYDAKPHYAETSSSENFRTLQIWGRWNVSRRWQVYAFLPYKINERMNGNHAEQIHRFGDAQMQVRYFWINQNNSNRIWRHALQTGVGIKLPTGKYDVVQHGMMLNPTIQAGTGSYDKLFLGQYNLRYKQWGTMVNAQYSFNGTNAQHLHFGNKIQSAWHVYHWFQSKHWIFLPQVGLAAERSAPDTQNKVVHKETGGHMLLCAAGTDMYYRNLGLSTQIQIPTKQNLGDGYIQSSPRINLTFILSL